MKTIARLFALLSLSLCFQSCLRLDSNLFHNTKLTKYLMEDNRGEQEITLDASYKLPSSMIHLVPLVSDDNGDTATIYAEYLGDMSRVSVDTIILYFHGTKDNMDYYWNRAKLLANIGGKNHFGVMMIDYRGYGMSGGQPTESGMYADAAAAINWLHKAGVTNRRLVVYGFSLGSAPAVYRTANPLVMSPAKLILEAPFASAEVMVQDATLLALPASYFTNLKIDNASEIRKVEQPLMWIHGINDDFLSITTHGEVVFKNYHGIDGEAHRVDGGTHSNVPIAWGIENYKAAVLEFIRK